MALVVKNPAANAQDVGDTGLILGLGRSLGEGHGNHAISFTHIISLGLGNNPKEQGAMISVISQKQRFRDIK